MFYNAMADVANWQSNAFFYRAIVEVAQANPATMFIIRGKNDDWCNIPEMRDSLELIQSQTNIKIDRDYDKFDQAHFLAAVADLVVLPHSSIGDQCLAAGIPVLFYEELPNGEEIIKPWRDYSPYPVLCHNLDELLSRFKETIDGNYMSDGQLTDMRHDCYATSPDDSSELVSVRIQTALVDLLGEVENEADVQK